MNLKGKGNGETGVKRWRENLDVQDHSLDQMILTPIYQYLYGVGDHDLDGFIKVAMALMVNDHSPTSNF